jgi:hypothetical protein
VLDNDSEATEGCKHETILVEYVLNVNGDPRKKHPLIILSLICTPLICVKKLCVLLLDTPKPPLFKFLVPTYYGDISFFDAHLLGEEKNEFAVR